MSWDEEDNIELESGMEIKSTNISKYYCTNCNKKRIHCIGGSQKGEPVQLIKNRCVTHLCECRCRTHYIARSGVLRKYGTIDDTLACEPDPVYKDEKGITELLENYRSRDD